MKKVMLATVGLVVLSISGLFASWDGGTEIQKGRRIVPAQINVTSTTAVNIIVPTTNDVYNCDTSIVNNTDYILWISSWSGVTKSNGFPILPKTHYSPSGITIADIWAIFDDGMSGTAKVYTLKFTNK